MRIRELRIRDVQRHARLDLELAPGLTVIRGPNEAGKSTVQRALELALFRRCTAAGREMEAVRRWGAAEGAPAVELEFEDEGVPGRLVKRFAGARGSVELRIGEERITDPAEADHRLAEMTGLPSEKFFRSTASVHHQELDDLERDEATLRDRLEASMSGATRGTSAAKRRLEDAVRRYSAQGPKNPGHLKRTRDEIAALDAELRLGEAELARLERDQASLSGARERRTRAEERLAGERTRLQESERAVILLAEKEEAQARYERLKRAAELQLQIAELGAAHPSPFPLATLRDAVARLRRIEQRISEIRAELVADSDARAYEVAALPARWQPWAVLAMIFIVVALMTGRAAVPGVPAATSGAAA
ncbi:MAG: AAA family ATPase, partial [Chloroflexota bacterium]|nr:AAA family ATPase [Chloroflexota bacterium]